MEKERLKLILRNLKSLVNALEVEIYADKDAYTFRDEDMKVGLTSCDDDDGYPD